MVIKVNLTEESIAAAVKELNAYADSLQEKAKLVAEKLAEQGKEQAQNEYSKAFYDGTNDVRVSVEKTETGANVVAQGASVLFIEFGAGITFGYGHPKPLTYGPGTYPKGKGHWSDPRGWWYPINGTNMSGNWINKAGTHVHTYGNPPSKSMYNTAQEVKRNVYKVAKEVFSND